MRKSTTLVLASLVVLSIAVSNSYATFIQPSTITATSTSFNTPEVLINEATANGGTAFVPIDPSSGGPNSTTGTSWYTSSNTATLTFGFASTSALTFLEELYMWDYYRHSPTDWTLKLYSGAGATGTELLDYDFSIVPGTSGSTLHTVTFSDIAGALSGTLANRNTSAGLGVGLAEIGFSQVIVPVPEPSSLLLFGLGAIGLIRHTRRCRRKA